MSSDTVQPVSEVKSNPSRAPQSIGAQPQHPELFRRFMCAVFDIGMVVNGLVGLLVLTPLTVTYIVLVRIADGTQWAPPDPTRWNGTIGVLAALIFVLYFGFMESGQYRTSAGKLVGGMWVSDMHGERVSFRRALWRNVLKLALLLAAGRSFLAVLDPFIYNEPVWKSVVAAVVCILCVGTFAMARFTRRRQTLHDILSGTRVVE
ncbi:MAG: RDD family protein [Candidatus Hydrogenedentes bacterium]|nr:RDD family protein [Candidatus Hydrogenedentota bacterium]